MTAPAFSKSIPASSAPGPCSSPNPSEQPPQKPLPAGNPLSAAAAGGAGACDAGAAPAPPGTQGAMRRQRRTKVVATLGPASSDRAVIARLFEAGADVFRINMSHTIHERMRELVTTIRAVEARA